MYKKTAMGIRRIIALIYECRYFRLWNKKIPNKTFSHVHRSLTFTTSQYEIRTFAIIIAYTKHLNNHLYSKYAAGRINSTWNPLGPPRSFCFSGIRDQMTIESFTHEFETSSKLFKTN